MTIDLTAMLEKRREVLGDANKFSAEFKGTNFLIVAAELASEEFNEAVANLREDANDGALSETVMKSELIELFLEDQATEFRVACNEENVDPFVVLTWAIEGHAEAVEANPTRVNSRDGRRRSKRR